MTTPYDPQNPGARPGPAGWDSSQPSLRSAAKDTVASMAPGTRTFGNAWAAGKMLGEQRYGAQPADADQYGNGNGGEADPHDEINSKLDSLSEKVSGMQGGAAQQTAAGGAQDRNNAFQGGGSQQAAAPRPDVLGARAEHNAGMYAQMADSHAALMGGMANTMARFQQRQSSFHPVGTSSSGIGMSARQSEATMSGLLPVQNGISDSQYENQRFRNGGQ